MSLVLLKALTKIALKLILKSMIVKYLIPKPEAVVR